MANIITGIRIVISAGLLFCIPLSPAFYVLYIIGGISDMIDGAVARKTNTVSGFGSRLDTAADLVFVIVCMVRLIPVLDIPVWLYVWTALIALIKTANIVTGYLRRKEFPALHTVMNKITGAMLFALPLTLQVIEPEYSAAAVCAAATAAAVQEGHIIRTGKQR